MRFTVPQLRLLKEGELYGNYIKGGDMPIDQLINFVQAHFIDWDLSNPKFISWFEKTHPYASEAYLSEMGGMKQVLLDELPGANQSENLINALLKKTEASRGTTSGIMDAPIVLGHGAGSEYFDLSVRAQRVLHDLGLNTVGKLIKTPKSDILAHRFVGRITIKEITRKVGEFLQRFGHGRNAPWGPATAPESAAISAWVDSEANIVRPPKRSAKSPPWPSHRKYP